MEESCFKDHCATILNALFPIDLQKNFKVTNEGDDRSVSLAQALSNVLSRAQVLHRLCRQRSIPISSEQTHEPLLCVCVALDELQPVLWAALRLKWIGLNSKANHNNSSVHNTSNNNSNSNSHSSTAASSKGRHSAAGATPGNAVLRLHKYPDVRVSELDAFIQRCTTILNPQRSLVTPLVSSKNPILPSFAQEIMKSGQGSTSSSISISISTREKDVLSDHRVSIGIPRLGRGNEISTEYSEAISSLQIMRPIQQHHNPNYDSLHYPQQKPQHPHKDVVETNPDGSVASSGVSAVKRLFSDSENDDDPDPDPVTAGANAVEVERNRNLNSTLTSSSNSHDPVQLGDNSHSTTGASSSGVGGDLSFSSPSFSGPNKCGVDDNKNENENENENGNNNNEGKKSTACMARVSDSESVFPFQQFAAKPSEADQESIAALLTRNGNEEPQPFTSQLQPLLPLPRSLLTTRMDAIMMGEPITIKESSGEEPLPPPPPPLETASDMMNVRHEMHSFLKAGIVSVEGSTGALRNSNSAFSSLNALLPRINEIDAEKILAATPLFSSRDANSKKNASTSLSDCASLGGKNGDGGGGGGRGSMHHPRSSSNLQDAFLNRGQTWKSRNDDNNLKSKYRRIAGPLARRWNGGGGGGGVGEEETKPQHTNELTSAAAAPAHTRKRGRPSKVSGSGAMGKETDLSDSNSEAGSGNEDGEGRRRGEEDDDEEEEGVADRCRSVKDVEYVHQLFNLLEAKDMEMAAIHADEDDDVRGARGHTTTNTTGNSNGAAAAAGASSSSRINKNAGYNANDEGNLFEDMNDAMHRIDWEEHLEDVVCYQNEQDIAFITASLLSPWLVFDPNAARLFRQQQQKQRMATSSEKEWSRRGRKVVEEVSGNREGSATGRDRLRTLRCFVHQLTPQRSVAKKNPLFPPPLSSMVFLDTATACALNDNDGSGDESQENLSTWLVSHLNETIPEMRESVAQMQQEEKEEERDEEEEDNMAEEYRSEHMDENSSDDNMDDVVDSTLATRETWTDLSCEWAATAMLYQQSPAALVPYMPFVCGQSGGGGICGFPLSSFHTFPPGLITQQLVWLRVHVCAVWLFLTSRYGPKASTAVRSRSYLEGGIHHHHHSRRLVEQYELLKEKTWMYCTRTLDHTLGRTVPSQNQPVQMRGSIHKDGSRFLSRAKRWRVYDCAVCGTSRRTDIQNLTWSLTTPFHGQDRFQAEELFGYVPRCFGSLKKLEAVQLQSEHTDIHDDTYSDSESSGVPKEGTTAAKMGMNTTLIPSPTAAAMYLDEMEEDDMAAVAEAIMRASMERSDSQAQVMETEEEEEEGEVRNFSNNKKVVVNDDDDEKESNISLPLIARRLLVASLVVATSSSTSHSTSSNVGQKSKRHQEHVEEETEEEKGRKEHSSGKKDKGICQFDSTGCSCSCAACEAIRKATVPELIAFALHGLIPTVESEGKVPKSSTQTIVQRWWDESVYSTAPKEPSTLLVPSLRVCDSLLECAACRRVCHQCCVFPIQRSPAPFMCHNCRLQKL